jgi:hypothetical protein
MSAPAHLTPAAGRPGASTRTLALGGLAALALLGGAAVLLVQVLEPDGASPAPAAAPPPADPVAAPALPASPGLAPPAPASAVGPAPPPAIRSMPRATADVAWEEVPEAARLHDLGPGLAAPVSRGLQAARAQLDGCFEEEARALARRATPPDPEALGPAILVLRLESRPGALDVADVEVEAQGTSTPELVACARHVLRGWPIPAAGAEAGRRYRLKWLLQ